MNLARKLTLLCAALTIHCGADEAAKPTDSCGEKRTECVDEASLRVCRDDQWQSIRCADWCDATSSDTRSRPSSPGCLRLIGRDDECACSSPRVTR